ncbi:hypothetical protein BH10CYA1_BH10CYA1_12530 [soil metagenome]
MQPFKFALLLIATSFAFGPAATLAQVPDHVQSPSSTASIGQRESLQSKAIADERTRQIESVRSDIADLSKFEHGNEYLPKSLYKRDYVDNEDNVPAIAGHERPNYGVEHHM